MSSNRDFDREVTFEIVEEIGVIAAHSTGWKKELNLVSWNGGPAKYDIRDWDPDHSRMSRGVTLKEQEMRQIVDLLRKRRPHRRDRDQEQGVMMEAPPASAEAVAGAPAADRQNQAAVQPSEGSLRQSIQGMAEPQEMMEAQQMAETQQMAEPQETGMSGETEDDFFVPEARNLETAAENGCACCS